MLRVKCNSCGRVYDYRKDEICPQCGAYNRPPHREVVEADGTVHILEEKACYEQKVCYEAQTRPQKTAHTERAPQKQRATQPEAVKKLLREAQRLTGRKISEADAEAMQEALPTMTEKQQKLASGLIKFAGARNKVGLVIVGLVLLSIAVNFIQERQSDYDIDLPEEQVIETETLQEYRAIGDELAVDGVRVVVDGAVFEEDEITVDVQVDADEDFYFEPQLCWRDESGYEHMWWSDSWESAKNNTIRRYAFDMEDPIECDYTADEEGYYLTFYTMADEDTQVEYLIPLGSGNA